MSNEPTSYFVAWTQGDNPKEDGAVPLSRGREEFKYRVFRDDRGSRSAYAITEAMTYEEAEVKRKEILLITKGKELA